MAKIAFMMVPGSSHLVSALLLSKRLKTHGHETIFLSLQRDREFLKKNQTDFHSILNVTLAPNNSKAKEWNPIKKLVISRRMEIKAFQELADDQERFINEWSPDLFLVDAMMPFAVFMPQKHGIPCVLVSTMLPTTREGGLPPIDSILPPAKTFLDKVRIRRQWYKRLIRRRIVDALIDLRRQSRNLAQAAGVPLHHLNWNDYFTFDLPIPKIVLCPEALDFQRPYNPQRLYVGPGIDEDRDEPDFPWERIVNDKPLVYCSLSTLVAPTKKVKNLYASLLAAFRRRKDLQLVLSTSGGELVQDGLSDNITIVKRAPQLSLLKRADLAITVGGLNTIKECLFYGTPMIVFPEMHDQLGNAARIVHKGLGLLGDINRVNPNHLTALIDKALEDQEIRRKINEMQEIFHEAESSPALMNFLEDILRRRMNENAA